MEKNALSAYLKMARKNAGYQQEEIATQLGITRATYSHYENSRIVPPTEAMYKLSEIYHVPVEHLMKLSITKQEDSAAPKEEKTPLPAKETTIFLMISMLFIAAFSINAPKCLMTS